MTDFRIEVFLAVARHLSFTKASNELMISQPAISKHISELESIYGIQLFERSQNRVRITPHGERFMHFAEQLHTTYRELLFEMNQLSAKSSGSLTIGASTTVANYILPSVMAEYMRRHPDVELSLIAGNSEQIEELISQHRVDLGIIEGAKHRGEHHYARLTSDELVLVASPKITPPESITIEELKQLPILLREHGSGTLEVIEKALRSRGVKLPQLNVVMQLGSTEAIKRFIIAGNAYAILSIASLRQELQRHELTVVEIDDLTIDRDFTFITASGSQDRMVEDFIAFTSDHYNQML